MELVAIAEALEAYAGRFRQLTVWTDSQYAAKTFNEGRIRKWETNGLADRQTAAGEKPGLVAAHPQCFDRRNGGSQVRMDEGTRRQSGQRTRRPFGEPSRPARIGPATDDLKPLTHIRIPGNGAVT